MWTDRGTVRVGVASDMAVIIQLSESTTYLVDHAWQCIVSRNAQRVPSSWASGVVQSTQLEAKTT